MKGSNIRRAEVRDAETICHLYQTSIRGLGSNHYNPEQIERWANRPIEAFAQDIQNTLLFVCEYQNTIIGYGQIDLQAAMIPAIYVHPDFARQKVGSFLFCFLECEASSADLPRLTAKVTLNAVEFFRAHDYAELGSTTLPLPDGTHLPVVTMERQLIQRIEFAETQSLAERALASLRCNHSVSRMHALRRLKQQSPAEVLHAIVSLLEHPEEAIRQRAGGALTTLYSPLRGEAVNVEQKADDLAHYLQHGADSRVRLSCAIVLMSVKTPAVDQAYVHALRDTEPRVAQLACLEVGDRGGGAGTAALFGMLNHPIWRVRLEACKALITQKTADQRVVSTLEAMSHESEAAVYDAENEDNAEMLESFMEATGHGDEIDKCWGKLDTIIRRARDVANQAGSDGQLNGT